MTKKHKSEKRGGDDGKSARSPKKKKRTGKSPSKNADANKGKSSKDKKSTDENAEYEDMIAKAEYELEMFGPKRVERKIMYLHASACDIDFLNVKQGDQSRPSGSGEDHVTKISHETFKQDVRVFDAYDSVRTNIEWDMLKKTRKPDVMATFVNPKWKG